MFEVPCLQKPRPWDVSVGEELLCKEDSGSEKTHIRSSSDAKEARTQEDISCLLAISGRLD